MSGVKCALIMWKCHRNLGWMNCFAPWLSFVKFSNYPLLVFTEDTAKHNNTSFPIPQCGPVLSPSHRHLSFSSPGFLVIKLEPREFHDSDIAWCQEVDRNDFVCVPTLSAGAHTLSMLPLSLLPCCEKPKTYRYVKQRLSPASRSYVSASWQTNLNSEHLNAGFSNDFSSKLF